MAQEVLAMAVDSHKLLFSGAWRFWPVAFRRGAPHASILWLLYATSEEAMWAARGAMQEFENEAKAQASFHVH